MNAGRELDALICEKFYGFSLSTFRDFYVLGPGQGYLRIPHFSTNLNDAWLVVEKLRQKYQVTINTYGNKAWVCELNDLRTEKYYPEIYGNSNESAPHAICLAALAAAYGEKID